MCLSTHFPSSTCSFALFVRSIFNQLIMSQIFCITSSPLLLFSSASIMNDIWVPSAVSKLVIGVSTSPILILIFFRVSTSSLGPIVDFRFCTYCCTGPSLKIWKTPQPEANLTPMSSPFPKRILLQQKKAPHRATPVILIKIA